MFCFIATLAFGQGGTATITGTITDPAGLVIAGATLQARNTETGAIYSTASTATGNYAVTDLPVGSYTLSATASGFKAYSHTNLALAATQVLREDIGLQVFVMAVEAGAAHAAQLHHPRYRQSPVGYHHGKETVKWDGKEVGSLDSTISLDGKVMICSWDSTPTERKSANM